MGMIGMLVGILVAFFIYHHAKGRGHSTVIAFLWAIASGIMPIILVPLYFLLGQRGTQQSREGDSDIIDIEATVIEEEIMNCPKCKSEVKEDFIVCPYCQTPIGQEERYHKK